jgi:hypothetical protein
MKHPKNLTPENDIESVALGTLLSGMRKLYWETEQYMRVRIEEVERRYQQLVGTARVAARHELDGEQPVVMKRRGRPRKEMPTVRVMRESGWSSDPEERSREMRRRFKVRDQKREQNQVKHLSPRDKAHPDHAEWKKKLGRARKREWAAMTPAQRKARLAAMAAGKQQKANGHLGAQ